MNTLNAIDKYLEDQDLWKESTKVMSSHHPSAVNNCMRQQWYKWKAVRRRQDGSTELMIPVTDPRKAKDIWRMSMGTWIHNGYAELMAKIGFNVKSEEEITYHDPRLKHPIHGYIDNEYVYESDAGEMIQGIEVKTTFGYGAKALQIANEPKENDLAQAKVYLAIRRNINGFSMPYIARDSFYRTEFQVFMSQEERDEYLEKIVTRFELMEMLVEKNIMPKRDFQVCIKDGELRDSVQHKGVKYKSDWQCMYCIRRSLCWADELASMDMILPDNGEEVKPSKKSQEETLECIAE